MREDMMNKLKVILADTYALYLKTQNYHWHVTGPQFKPLHELFEIQYRELAEAIDAIAERIRILGHIAPASFHDFMHLKTLQDGDAEHNSNQMVTELALDHGTLVRDLNQAMVLAQAANDEGTVALLSERIAAHEKNRWMLSASTEKS